MPMNPDLPTPVSHRPIVLILTVFLAAVVMGLPTLHGGFVGGDDHRLVLNHVLVNHPSITHAVQLFTIVHRDLYQPLPLLTFSGEFAVANLFGLFESSIEGGAWLFHLTNVLLHAINTVLVWLTIRTLQQRLGVASLTVATVGALLFAVHPFQVEVVAWVNGRMMLLSTLFALASILTFSRWLDTPRSRYAILTLLFVLFSSLSKARVGLPFLLGLAALIQGHRLRTRFWSLWVPCVALTGWFAWINYQATAGADLFAEGAQHLWGPWLVRVLLALAFYFQHLVWPVGLASYYPTPFVVHWSDASTAVAAIIVASGLVILAFFCRRSRPCRWGVLWFFIAIADTLALIPARNVLAADRYLYLPIVGLFWCLAAVTCHAYSRWKARSASKTRQYAAASITLLFFPAMIGQSWFTAKWYNTPLLKTQRVADCFPNEPRVWEKLGWCHYQAGDYDKAIEYAQRELAFDDRSVQSIAYQLMGLSHLKQGRNDEALRLLHHALEVDPDNDIGLYRLATAYDDLGRLDEALPYYEAATKAAPLHNPTLYRLASVYRRLGRTSDARAAYEKQLVNNPYDVPAALALVELDIEIDTAPAYRDAAARLVKLLADVPDDLPARLNLAVLILLKIDLGDVPTVAAALRKTEDLPPKVAAALAYAALCEGRFDEAVARVTALCRTSNAGADARRLLLTALKRFDQQRPEVPWTFGLTAELLLTDGQLDAARAFTDLFESRCDEPACRDYTRSLRQRLAKPRAVTP